MKLLEATLCYPKFVNREPKDESEVLLKKVFFIPQNVVAIFEEVEKPMAKTRIELAGGIGFLITETIEDLATRINTQLQLEVK